MKQFLIFFLFQIGVLKGQELSPGFYHAELCLNKEKNIVLPFTLSIQADKSITFYNGEEAIECKELNIQRDSFILKMPIFDSEFHFISNKKELTGYWFNNSRSTKNKIPFCATTKKSTRFIHPKRKHNEFFSERWEVTFGYDSISSNKAVGIFKVKNGIASGTFLTETGDYRFLEGITTETQILLSCFDGSHAFLFIAEMNSLGEIIGRFYSGSHWEENWKGKKNTNFSLRKADEITQIEEPNSQLNFKFINIHGQTVTLEDEKFRNKMVILQLMGSWCPNCMDETKYFSELYEKFKPNGLEIVGICFERTEDTLKARKNILRLKERFNVNYELLVTGLSGKEKASETFPMLSKVSAFPTTLYLNRDKKIVRVHSGFSGPATGEEYEKFKSETEKLILDLLK